MWKQGENSVSYIFLCLSESKICVICCIGNFSFKRTIIEMVSEYIIKQRRKKNDIDIYIVI